MNITDTSSPPSFFSRLFTAYSLWAWGGIITSIIICCTVTWLHYQQRNLLGLASADLTTIRQARIDLAKGFLHVSLGDYSASPFNRDQGLALLNQAMASLENSVQKARNNPVEPESLAALQSTMQLFQGHLVEWSLALERKPHIETALRSVFYNLERQADHIDSNIQQKLHQQYAHLDYIFILTIFGAFLLLAGFCSAIYVAGRHQEKNARALREKEHHFRSYFERAMVGMAATSPSKGWLEVNPALLEMMGYTTAEFAGKTWAELTHPDDLAEDVAQFEQLLAGKLDGYSMEKRFFRKNGEIVWTVMAVQAVRHPDGSVNYCVAIIEDISDRKRDEKALKQSEEHYRLLFHSNPLPMWMYDLETLAFLEVNTAAIDHYGYSREEFLAMTIKDIRPAEDLPKLLESVQRVNDGLDHAGNWRHLRQDGNIIDVAITSHTLEFEGRKAELVLSYDITERKVHEAEIERLSRLYATMSQINQIIVRVNSHEELTREVARIAVEFGGSKIAWVGRYDSQTREVTPVGWAGKQWEVIRNIRHSLADTAEQPCLCGPVILENRSCVFNDLSASPEMSDWLTRVGQAGIRAAAVFPIRVRDTVWGVFGVYEGEPNVFQDKEISLLEEAAMDIGYAIEHIENEAQRRLAEASLQESEQHVRAFIDNAKSLVWIKDLDGRFLVANPYTESVLGLPEDQIVGRTVFEIFPDEYAYPYTDNDRQVLDVGQAITFEETAMLGDGQHTYISVKFPLRDSTGRTYAIGAICTDITDRKRAEEALLRNEVHLRTLVDTLPDLIWLKDPQGAYMSCNSRFESFFGATEAEVVGKTDYDFLDRQLADFFRANDDIAVAAGGPQVNEEEVTFASDGHHEILETIKTPMFDADGRLIGVLGIARDITMRRQQEKERANLEAQLLQAQKMESVGRLAGGVAHDFNNMLGVILGTTDMLLEQIEPTNPVHSDLVEIRKAGERSANLTRQLLAFARKQTVAPKVIDLNKALHGMAKMLERLIGEEIALEWIQDEDVWPIKIDPGQIDQLLANLCVNARDAIAGVGRITIETANRVFDEAYCMNHVGWLPGEYVMLAVSDNGCGMDSETMSHLFEPFYTTKELGKGTGLGLATTYGVVKQNEGFIDVYSEIGKGTTFRIYLPRHQAKTALLPEMKPDSPHETGHEIILLVEDEPAILKMTARMLEREGYTVVAASTPGEAIRLANEHHGDIHLLITDVVMPEMNGRDLAKNIRSLYPHLKRLFMSGYTADIIAHHGVLDRGVCFLQKPFSKSDLTAKVREILDGINVADVESLT